MKAQNNSASSRLFPKGDKRYLQLLVASLILFVALINRSYSADYYVSPTGNNSHPGTLSQPWQTVSKAASTLIAGDTVYIRQGIYNEQIVPLNSGTASNPITYTGYPGETATIDGQLTLPEAWSGIIYIYGKQYITISGLKITRAGPYHNNCGVLVEDASNIVIENNYIFDTVSSGIGVWNSQNITIDRNEVEKACNDGEQECITIAGTVNFLVSNNHVHHNGPGTNGGEGIDAKDGAALGTIINNTVHNLTRLGIYVDAWDKYTHDIIISGNRIYDCENDGITLASEQGGLLQNISVINNLVFRNRYNGITVTPNGDVAKPPMTNISIINNTFFRNGDGTLPDPWGGGLLIETPNINTLQIKNNIFSDNLLFQIVVDVPVTSLTIGYNLIHGFRTFSNETFGSNAVVKNPQFENPFNANFHLKPTSPAIDSGTASGAPLRDFDFNLRPKGKGFDIGAFEFQLIPRPPVSISGPNFLLLRQ